MLDGSEEYSGLILNRFRIRLKEPKNKIGNLRDPIPMRLKHEVNRKLYSTVHKKTRTEWHILLSK